MLALQSSPSSPSFSEMKNFAVATHSCCGSLTHYRPQIFKKTTYPTEKSHNIYIRTYIGNVYKNAKGLINTYTVVNYQIDIKYVVCYTVKFFSRAIYSVLLRTQEKDPSWRFSYKVLYTFGR